MVCEKQSYFGSHRNHLALHDGGCDRLFGVSSQTAEHLNTRNKDRCFDRNRNAADIMSPSLDPIPEPQVFYFDVPLSEELQDYIREKCSEYKVPMELVIALIDKESSFRSDVVSTTNDYGFMQINQCNHEWLSSTLGVSNFLDPKENILCGIFIISGHLEKPMVMSNSLLCGITAVRVVQEDCGIKESTQQTIPAL